MADPPRSPDTGATPPWVKIFGVIVRLLAARAQQADGASLRGLGGDLLHPGLGLVVLLVIQVLNVYKPPGMTLYGQRKQHQQRTASQPTA